MNVFDALKSINAYPIPSVVIEDACDQGQIGTTDEMNAIVRNSDAFKIAKSAVYAFLAEAPNVSQGGVSYSFTSTEKEYFRQKASNLALEASNGKSGAEYGWQGENF